MQAVPMNPIYSLFAVEDSDWMHVKPAITNKVKR